MEHSQILRDLTHPSVTDEPEHVRKSITIYSDPYAAIDGTHAIVLCTEWDEFIVSFFKTFFLYLNLFCVKKFVLNDVIYMPFFVLFRL